MVRVFVNGELAEALADALLAIVPGARMLTTHQRKGTNFVVGKDIFVEVLDNHPSLPGFVGAHIAPAPTAPWAHPFVIETDTAFTDQQRREARDIARWNKSRTDLDNFEVIIPARTVADLAIQVKSFWVLLARLGLPAAEAGEKKTEDAPAAPVKEALPTERFKGLWITGSGSGTLTSELSKKVRGGIKVTAFMLQALTCNLDGRIFVDAGKYPTGVVPAGFVPVHIKHAPSVPIDDGLNIGVDDPTGTLFSTILTLMDLEVTSKFVRLVNIKTDEDRVHIPNNFWVLQTTGVAQPLSAPTERFMRLWVTGVLCRDAGIKLIRKLERMMPGSVTKSVPTPKAVGELERDLVGNIFVDSDLPLPDHLKTEFVELNLTDAVLPPPEAPLTGLLRLWFVGEPGPWLDHIARHVRENSETPLDVVFKHDGSAKRSHHIIVVADKAPPSGCNFLVLHVAAAAQLSRVDAAQQPRKHFVVKFAGQWDRESGAEPVKSIHKADPTTLELAKAFYTRLIVEQKRVQPGTFDITFVGDAPTPNMSVSVTEGVQL